MNIKDIIALAHAGFSAEQIGKLALMVPAAPAAPVAPAAPAAPSAPAAPVAPAAPSAPASPAAPAQIDFFEQIMSKFEKLENNMQAAAILGSQQPTAQTDEQILASILVPPMKE